jgi:7,8-dihydropterin-6-yl-methyl-4-(beta-D-ribofuranosyl)aminobenzene 5'-phosphate synthase
VPRSTGNRSPPEGRRICTETGPADPAAVAFAAPRAAAGAAVDPIVLEPVDALTITVLVDNSFDALLANSGVATRARLGTGLAEEAPQYVGGTTTAGMVAEHGFSALVTVTRDGHDHTLLFDTGVSSHGMATNGRRLGVDPSDIAAVVLSHGHADHTGGFPGLERWLGRVPSPLVLHPAAFTRRRLAPPGGEPFVMPQLDRAALTGDGIELVERREPSFLLGGSVLVTGEVDRTTEFEQGMAFHEAFLDEAWRPDPWIVDDQALVVDVRGRGLVVLTGCGHAGAVNIARHALRLTGADRLHGLLGGLHLTGPGFERIIEPTVAALAELAPDVVVPAHCTGWRAQMRLAQELGDAFLPGAVGSRYAFTAAGTPRPTPA